MRKIACFLMFLLSFNGFSQEEEPKVGLVLSGGGAKGLAHIGALKVIEESGVKIDYIGGSSMGAIIGALYAAGYSAHQLDSIFKRTDFNLLIQDELPRSVKTFYEKSDSEKYGITLPFDDFQISFPSALSRGQNIYNLMSKLTLHLKDENDFTKLPIPFFTVATDVETGEEVILDRGHLPQAISASAAIPSLFSPVEIDGRLLTDGGVVNNYPVEELRRRGADIIVGVDVQDTLAVREDLKSAFSILTQINNFKSIQDMRAKSKKTDIFIKPNILPFSVMSFDEGSAIIDAGEVATREKMEELQAVAAFQKKQKIQVENIKVIDSLYITDVRIKGTTSYPRSYILGKLKLKYPAAISYDDLRIGVNNLSATRNFNRVNYQLLPINDEYVLVLDLDENRSKTLLRLGLHYDNLYKSAALFNLTHKSSFFTNDVASLDVILGDNFRYNFNYYIDKGYYWSWGLRSRYNSFSRGVPFDFARENANLQESNVNQIELDYKDFTNQVYAETLFKRIFALGAGVEHKHLDVTSQTIGASSPDQPSTGVFDQSSYYSTFGFLKLDSFDNKYFPTTGVYFDGNWNWYLLSSDDRPDFAPFSIAKGQLGYVYTPVNRFTTRISSEAGFSVGNSRNNIFDFFLGGYGNNLINNFVPFYGYDFIDLSGDSFIKGMVEVDYRFYKKNHLILSGNFANVGNELFGSGEWFSTPDYTGYALGYSLETFMGPVELKYSFSPELRKSLWFFSIGFWF